MRDCPVCGADLSNIDSEAHLIACLSEGEDQTDSSARSSRIAGSRYVVFTLAKEEGSGARSECAICFEDFENGDRVARMNCLCVFHSTCIEEWFEVQRDRLGVSLTCPVHTG